MATDEDKELQTRKQVCRALKVTPRTLTRYASRADDPLQPVEPGGHGKPALYEPAEVVEWAIRQELAKLQEEAGHEDFIDYHHEKARLTRAQADREEIKLKVDRGLVARVELISFAVSNLGTQVSANLETLPAKIKRIQPSLTALDIREIQAEIIKVQNFCSEIEIDWDEAPELDP